MHEWRVYGDWLQMSDLEQYNLAIDADERATVAEARLEAAEAACLAAYRAWVQPAGSSHFVKDEASHLLIDIVRPSARAAGGGE